MRGARLTRRGERVRDVLIVLGVLVALALAQGLIGMVR